MIKINKIFVIEITALILLSGSLGGMFIFTDVYDETYSRIVSVLCLSCVKLDPKISFEWYLDKNPPGFVLESLDKTGPIFIMYSSSDIACTNCIIMEPVITDFFNITINKDNYIYSKIVNFNGSDVTFIYINIVDAERIYRSSKDYYDIYNVGGVPMFTTITLRYDHGIVKPYYNTVYGLLNQDNDESRIKVLTRIINEAIEFYKDNHEGFRPDDFKN